MLAAAHLHRKSRYRDRIAGTPVAGAGHADSLGAVFLDDVDGTLWRYLGLRIQRESGPEPVLENHVDGVFLGMIDHHALRVDLAVAPEHVDRDSRALVLVLEMRRVNQDQLPVLDRELDLVGIGRDLVSRDAVQPDFADAEDR